MIRTAVVTRDNQTRRQVARALRSGGVKVSFLGSASEALEAVREGCHLVVVDCDNSAPEETEDVLKLVSSSIPVILLSLNQDKTSVLKLVEGHDVNHLIAKHGAIRVSSTAPAQRSYALLDERELRVTCEKVVSQDIFGVDKYIGSWGVALHRHTIRSIADNQNFLDDFEHFLNELEIPTRVVPDVVTTADELAMNAVVHAPRRPDGSPKYEDLGPSRPIVLEPNEQVDLVFGSDGQRLMLSVSDRFGMLARKTLFDYLRRGISGLEVEEKTSGAGLGLSLSLRYIHQLVFNVHHRQRTEVIAGWYLRAHSAQEFKQVAKSLNVFWLQD